MTGTFPKNAGSTSEIRSKRARALCGEPRRRFHFSAPSEIQRKWTFLAKANRRDWFVRIRKRFCYRIDMLAKLSDGKRNRCAKRFLRRRSLDLSSLAGNLWIRFAALGERWLSGAFPGFTKFVQDRTQTRRKLWVQGGQVARCPEIRFGRDLISRTAADTLTLGGRRLRRRPWGHGLTALWRFR